MKLRITTLSENTACMGDFLAEWGLSILIETGEANILLDTGRSVSASYNADALGIDLSKIDKIVLSHCLLYTSPSPRDLSTSRMPSSA